MPRDREKSAYFTIGIPLESEVYRALKADAQETGISIPQLLAVRLADWYRFSTMPSLFEGLQASTSNGRTQTTHQHVPTPLNDLQERASAVAAAWGASEEE
jgi:hypothetical protein